MNRFDVGGKHPMAREDADRGQLGVNMASHSHRVASKNLVYTEILPYLHVCTGSPLIQVPMRCPKLKLQIKGARQDPVTKSRVIGSAWLKRGQLPAIQSDDRDWASDFLTGLEKTKQKKLLGSERSPLVFRGPISSAASY